ncbi:hypothetical protein Rcae01_01303 [Novipirellula caenicola]|uniref:Secreted protein n=1 Tax=Novipirellula caenicola TaxID=1536901 RepID=A0ABP9VMN6_9BACT
MGLHDFFFFYPGLFVLCDGSNEAADGIDGGNGTTFAFRLAFSRIVPIRSAVSEVFQPSFVQFSADGVGSDGKGLCAPAEGDDSRR